MRERNRARGAPVPPKVVAAQLREAAEVFGALAGEGFAGVAAAAPVELVPPAFLSAPAAATRQAETPLQLEFGLQVSRFGWEGATATALADVARAAEEAGFTSLWLMDHFLQIPQVGREWEDMLESYTTLGYLAGVTSRIRLGTLVTGVTYRNLAHLAKVVATLDVVSGGRALCGLGAGWFEREHKLYGWAFPPLRERFALLEDALELLPLMWGPGSPRFEGRTITVAEATCYPRPLQERVPILVGGSGERRTLRLVARHADACNLFGDPAAVRAQARRAALVVRDRGARPRRDHGDAPGVGAVVAAGEPREGQGAATVEEHVGRYRELAEAGVQTAIVGLSDARGPESVTRFADVVAAFRLRLARRARARCCSLAPAAAAPRGPPKLVTETVGSGPQTATIVRPDVDGRVPVVLFLHGWGATRPRFYRPWIDHLARAGNAVIYPRYQDSVVDQPSEVLGNALAGVRLALKQVDEEPGSLVVAGHSAGGALAADYAAIARTAKLPQPVAVFSAYPGRTLRGVRVGHPGDRPGPDPGRHARSSRWRARDDRWWGAAWHAGSRARRAGASSSSTTPASDHLGPQRATAASRREFWARLDALIRRARARRSPRGCTVPRLNIRVRMTEAPPWI